MVEPTGPPGRWPAPASRTGERAALARADERRRLRADLHDGIGPALLGAVLRLEALGRQLAGDDRATALLAAVGEDLRACREELDRLVDGLGPASCDSGLPGALRRELARFRSARLRVVLDCPEHLDGVGPETAAAVVLIAAEAVTNAVRHSNGTVCLVRLRRGRDLRLTVTDDGSGLARARGAGGAGLGSMRRRAVAAGGSLALATGPGGTRVAARLPPRAPDAGCGRPDR